MADLTIKVDGLNRVVRVFGRPVTGALRKIALAVATEVHSRLAPYAPSSEANRPRTDPPYWYERGFGTRYKSGRSRRTSETLGRRWDVSPKGSTDALVTNTASYAGWVHDADYQTWFHRDRGWKTDDAVIRDVTGDGTIERFAERFIGDAFDD